MGGSSGARPNRHGARDSETMLNRFGVGIGAGLASALLFAVTVKGTALAMALAYLTPLPIMIIALGWGLTPTPSRRLAGIIVAIVIDPTFRSLFTLTISCPPGSSPVLRRWTSPAILRPRLAPKTALAPALASSRSRPPASARSSASAR